MSNVEGLLRPVLDSIDVLRATVALERQQMPAYGALQPLAPGMQLDADVPIERRKLYEWLFEPVLGMVGRV